MMFFLCTYKKKVDLNFVYVFGGIGDNLVFLNE